MLGVSGWISVVSGGLLVLSIAWLTSDVKEAIGELEPSMRWEGGVAIAFAVLVYGTPFWLLQVLTAVVGGARAGSGRVWLVLLLWAFLSPGVAASPPSRATVRLVRRVVHRGPAGG